MKDFLFHIHQLYLASELSDTKARGRSLLPGEGPLLFHGVTSNHCLLGALPDKGDLMHDPAMDEELERL